MDSKLSAIERAILADPENQELHQRLRVLYKQHGFEIANSVERIVQGFGHLPTLVLLLLQYYEEELNDKLETVRFFGEDQGHPNQPPHIREVALEFSPLFRAQRRALESSLAGLAPLGFDLFLPGFHSKSLAERAIPLIAALQDIDEESAGGVCRQPIVVAMRNTTEMEAMFGEQVFTRFRVDAMIRSRGRCTRGALDLEIQLEEVESFEDETEH